MLILFDYADVVPSWIYLYTTLFGHTYSAMNPILYAKFNPLLRGGLKTLFSKVYDFKQSQVNTITGTTTTNGNASVLFNKNNTQ